MNIIPRNKGNGNFSSKDLKYAIKRAKKGQHNSKYDNEKKIFDNAGKLSLKRWRRDEDRSRRSTRRRRRWRATKQRTLVWIDDTIPKKGFRISRNEGGLFLCEKHRWIWSNLSGLKKTWHLRFSMLYLYNMDGCFSEDVLALEGRKTRYAGRSSYSSSTFFFSFKTEVL